MSVNYQTYEVRVYKNSSREWCLNGKRHREDGPAVEFANGTRHWYLNGKLHRTDGPAVECADDGRYWYANGKLHRTDGPAIELTNGKRYWYLNGELFKTESEWRAALNSDTCAGKVIEIDGKRYKLQELDQT